MDGTPSFSRTLSIQRTELHEDLTQLLRPDKKAQYAVVVGAAGTGKSTAVRRAVRSLNEPKGAVYFLPPTLLTSFASELARVLGYYRPVRWADRVVRLVTGETEEVQAPPLAAEPQATWSVLEPCLVNAAARYRAKHGKPAALVLDGMDLVAKKDPGFFLKVQDFAKKCADAGILSVVLVFSDGRALPLLESSAHPDGTYAFHDRHVMRFMERAAATDAGDGGDAALLLSAKRDVAPKSALMAVAR